MSRSVIKEDVDLSQNSYVFFYDFLLISVEYFTQNRENPNSTHEYIKYCKHF